MVLGDKSSTCRMFLVNYLPRRTTGTWQRSEDGYVGALKGVDHFLIASLGGKVILLGDLHDLALVAKRVVEIH